MAVSSMDEEQSLLRNFGLKEDFEGSLSREEFHEITKNWLENKPPARLDELPKEFIRNVSRLYSCARNVTVEKIKSGISRLTLRDFINVRNDALVHPLDIVVIVFLWCCNLVRQDLVKCMWDCRLAIPFAVTRKDKTNAFLWPLQILNMKWTVMNSESEDTFEEPLARYPITRISAIKIGDDTRLSKSEILNCLASEKQLPMFFHRGLPSSTRIKSPFVDGMTEVAWSFPESTHNLSVSQPMMLLNLRGNALRHETAIDLLSELSDTAIVICHSEDLKDSKGIVEKLVSKSSVIMLITDETYTDETKHRLEDFLAFFQNLSDSVLDFRIALDQQIPRVVEDLRHTLDKMQRGDPTSLQDKVKGLNLDDVVVDEADADVFEGKQRASEILDVLRSEEPEVRKQQFVPLQGETWMEFAAADREIYELVHRENVPVDEYRDFKRGDMKYYRRIQHDMIKQGLPSTMKAILYHLCTLNTEAKQIFRRYLKLGIDDMTRENLQPFQNKHNEIVAQRNNPNTRKTRRKKLDEELHLLEEKMLQRLFGFEHIIREIAQIYEACCDRSSSAKTKLCICPLNLNQDAGTAQGENETCQYLKYTELPSIGVDILLDGYSLDVLDGDAMAVPTDWIEAIFREFKRRLQRRSKPVTIHAVSVLGIENSGKSTFLNALLGTRFSVSAGRCSRGVTMQQVKIADSLRNILGIDYIFVFDTEGLKSQDRLTASAKFDNMIATFAIGLSDTAILNLQGTNSAYLTETLPVSVQAFMTMKIAGIHPHCLVVHQGVDNTHKQALTQQNYKLERALDELIAMTEKLKSSPEVKRFTEVIKFDSSQDCAYISYLHEGKLPMAAVNTGYSEDTSAFGRRVLMNIKAEKNKRDTTEFCQTLIALWKAMKMEDFIFRFKSSLESAAAERLEDVMAALLMRFDDDLTKQRMTLLRRMDMCQTKDKCTALEQVTLNEANDCFQQNYKHGVVTLEEFFNAQSKTFENLLQPRRRETIKLLDCRYKACLAKVKEHIADDIANKQKELELHETYQQLLKQTCEEVSDLLRQRKCKDVLHNIIDERWSETEERIRSIRSKRMENLSINSDAHLLLREVFERQSSSIEKRLENKKNVALSKLETFRIADNHIAPKYFGFRAYNKTACEDILACLRFNIKSYVSEQERGPYPYRVEMIRHILRMVKDATADRKEITTDFQIDLAIAASEYAKENLRRIHLMFEQKNDPTDLIEKLKSSFKGNVMDTICRANETQRFSNEIAMMIADGLVCSSSNFLYQFLEQKIQKRERTGFMRNKKSFMVDVLIEIVEAGDWSVIREYAQNTDSLFEKMLFKRMRILIFLRRVLQRHMKQSRLLRQRCTEGARICTRSSKRHVMK